MCSFVLGQLMNVFDPTGMSGTRRLSEMCSLLLNPSVIQTLTGENKCRQSLDEHEQDKQSGVHAISPVYEKSGGWLPNMY